MNLCKRTIMFNDYKKGLNAKEYHETLQKVFPSSSPSFATVTFWFREFKRGRRFLEVEERSGRPSTFVNKEQIELVRKIFVKISCDTYEIIQNELKI